MKKVSVTYDDERCVALPSNVALFKGDISASVVAQLIGRNAAEAKRAIDGWRKCGVVVEPTMRNGPLRVRATARDAAFATTTSRQRRRAYEQIARAIDEPDAEDPELLEIARYYRDGGQFRLAIARYLTLAERNIDRDEREQAAAVVAEAASTIPSRGPEMLAVLDVQAQCAIAAGDMSFAMSILERLRRLAGICGDRCATVHAFLRCADCSLHTESFTAAIDYATRAIELCGSLYERSREPANAHLIIAEALDGLGRSGFAAQRLQAAAALGADRDTTLAARFRYVTGKLRLALDPLAAAIDFQAAAVTADNELDRILALKAARGLAAAQWQGADLFSASSTLRTALQTARAACLPLLARMLELDLLEAQFEAGRYRDARRLITPEIIASDAPSLLRIALQLGDAELIERCLSANGLEDALASRSPERIARVIPAFAQIERQRSGDAAGQALFRRAIEVIGDRTAPAEFWCDAAEYCASAELASVRAALERRSGTTPLGALVVSLGLLLVDRRSAADVPNLGARAEALANALLTAGFKHRAQRARAIGMKRQPAGRGHDVIELIAAGRSNAQIAAQLYLSKRTIEKTIGDLLKAHRVRSRWQLVARDNRVASERE